MSIEALVRELHKLNRAEKLRIVQLLVNDLAEEESPLQTNSQYEVWSPYDSASAAHQLSKLLEEDVQENDG